MRLIPFALVILTAVGCSDNADGLEHSRWTAPELQGNEEFVLADDHSFFVYLDGAQSCVGEWEFSSDSLIEASCTDDGEDRSYTLRNAGDDVLIWVFEHDSGSTSEVVFMPSP